MAIIKHSSKSRRCPCLEKLLIRIDLIVRVGNRHTSHRRRPRRRAIERHHTVTHLLHWALHELVNRDAAQKVATSARIS